MYLTEPAARALGVPELGLAHPEEYADAGRIDGRIIELGEVPASDAGGASGNVA